jgi:TolA-binding protein
LLKMAECYQKLGDSEAEATYERVIRDYADQKEASSAEFVGGFAGQRGDGQRNR